MVGLTLGMLDSLGKAIVTGRYDQRPFPTEGEITKAHGVSRSVTREAVKMLTAKGLVSGRPRQGTMVQPPSAWNLFDPDVLRWLLERKFSFELLLQFNQLRIAIEPEAAALAARFRTRANLQAIRAGIERMEAAETGPGDALDADIAFHTAVLRASHNPFYAQFETVVMTALRTTNLCTNRSRGPANIPNHAAVAHAIGTGDADGAREAMRRIIGDAIELIADG